MSDAGEKKPVSARQLAVLRLIRDGLEAGRRLNHLDLARALTISSAQAYDCARNMQRKGMLGQDERGRYTLRVDLDDYAVREPKPGLCTVHGLTLSPADKRALRALAQAHGLTFGGAVTHLVQEALAARAAQGETWGNNESEEACKSK